MTDTLHCTPLENIGHLYLVLTYFQKFAENCQEHNKICTSRNCSKRFELQLFLQGNFAWAKWKQWGKAFKRLFEFYA